MESLNIRCAIRILIVVVMAGALIKCAAKPSSKLNNTGAAKTAETGGMILDFETPNPAVAWKDSQPPASRPAPAGIPDAEIAETQPAPVAESQPAAPPMERSSVRPNTGLWAMQVTLSPGREGSLFHRFDRSRNLEKFFTISAAVMHLGTASRSGEWRAAVYVVDADGKRVAGRCVRGDIEVAEQCRWTCAVRRRRGWT